MTDKEKKALKEAFSFPEPDRKDEFLEEFARLSGNTKKKRFLPVIMRFAVSAAMMAVIIGVLTHMPKTTVDFGHDTDVYVTVTETTSTAENTSAVIVTSTEANKSDKVTTAKTTSSAVTSKAETTSGSTASSHSTSAVTTAVHTTVRTTAFKTEAREDVTQTPATTTSSRTQEQPVQADNSGDTGRDMTVSPDIIYIPRDKKIDEEQLYAKDGVGDQQGPGTGKPKEDTARVLENMYNDSSAVILANVDEMVYTSIGDHTVTAENLRIISSYKGDLITNDRITVFFSGGYIPAEKYIESHRDAYLDDPEEYSVYEAGSCRFRQEKDEQYIFFIRNDDSIKNGAYAPVRSGNVAVFRKVYENYVSVDDASIYFTEAQLNALR
ncbi:MAG: hypothetical protein J6X85_06425 [Ruminococcus sp.]|nr:hypothetical protein [Ruminococcus sp.]